MLYRARLLPKKDVMIIVVKNAPQYPFFCCYDNKHHLPGSTACGRWRVCGGAMASRAQGFRVVRGWGFGVWVGFYDFVLYGWVVSGLTALGLWLEEAE